MLTNVFNERWNVEYCKRLSRRRCILGARTISKIEPRNIASSTIPFFMYCWKMNSRRPLLDDNQIVLTGSCRRQSSSWCWCSYLSCPCWPATASSSSSLASPLWGTVSTSVPCPPTGITREVIALLVQLHEGLPRLLLQFLYATGPLFPLHNELRLDLLWDGHIIDVWLEVGSPGLKIDIF